MPQLSSFEWDAALRLLAAVGCGLLLGFNRDLKNKPTGMRTLGLVSLGACLVALASLQSDPLRTNPDAMSRVVQGVLQGVLTGVGFIGAGVVLKLPGDRRVRGLTTAATVWVTAALGVACAFASWPLLTFGLVLTLLVLILPRRIAKALGGDFDSPDDDD
ncbi:MgtC/SapB family protein [Chelatococcus sambhunathii]|uniref:Protein MgtC n=1 Tax=Chelatococcus sambhunathii TaxID=363953 RepID=A0ABU1DDG4_9HYPH|nr:MgtC/SapB family protein [Chelatococcus sambhunathii]MDR4306111.1 MgtC/SapB family protein [Chelatococcus sambhunathii]